MDTTTSTTVCGNIRKIKTIALNAELDFGNGIEYRKTLQ